MLLINNRYFLRCYSIHIIRTFLQLLILLNISIHSILAANYSMIDLHPDHIPLYFKQFPKVAEKCLKDDNCPYKDYIDKNHKKCWGYETYCKPEDQYSSPICPGDHLGWVKTKQDQQQTFYTQGDFGYIKQQLNEMMVMCEPLFPDDSSLECSGHLRFCRGRNLMINFTQLTSRKEPLRYKMDVLGEGDIGGYCTLHKDRLMKEADHISPLQSWGPELRYFQSLSRRPIVEGDCDVVIEKPTFLMKIDATVNMYHHFCDFLNLYASLHMNSTDENTFNTDVNILIWETYTYRSAFEETFKAFTKNPIWDLKTFRGETVCFKNVVLPLLPRMIFGLYYNTPLIYGCERSGLFHAFSKHILHRLEIPQEPRKNSKIRITLLSRDTKYRKILNEPQLLRALEKNKQYEVQRVIFNRDISFKKQLEVIHNSDVLIGIHGAGLSHLLFLPDWAAVFELYNCEDPNCYFDLARLRGLKYITWQNQSTVIQEDEGHHPNGGVHAKFTNYSFDEKEFLELVKKAAKHVKNHEQFKEYVAKSIIGDIHDEL